MKLSTDRIQQALNQFDQLTSVVPDNDPKAGELEEVFGKHTFFLDGDGLEIIEPVIGEEAGLIQDELGQVIRLAMWNDAGRTTLAARRAQVTGVVVVFPTSNNFS